MYGYDQMYIHFYTLSMFTVELIMNYNKYGNIGYTFMLDFDYPLYLQLLHRGLPFLTENGVINGFTRLLYVFLR